MWKRSVFPVGTKSTMSLPKSWVEVSLFILKAITGTTTLPKVTCSRTSLKSEQLFVCLIDFKLNYVSVTITLCGKLLA
ncbi:hypothetical protein BpHYR1_024572 [Brachionus plicatilis]|uniref:Uncharacterized protein n=1 Tax=Brachionus plicatilis TaxID=10195 RepID=A0A3M7PIR4_BRAPC|nr:hypothetical protein BpHYR1_024572 [Brachionus plicatilis]